jgi:hypothetical protein
MTHEATQQIQTSTETPGFPHRAAPAQTPLEAAERHYGERQGGVPAWQPEEGDFS